MSNCNKCQAEIIWDKPFVSGSRPKNPDNTLHECMKTGPKEPAQSKITETKPANKPTITDNALSSLTSLAECKAFNSKFHDLPDAKYDAIARVYNTLRMIRH